MNPPHTVTIFEVVKQFLHLLTKSVSIQRMRKRSIDYEIIACKDRNQIRIGNGPENMTRLRR